jgi:hypothetical protein
MCGKDHLGKLLDPDQSHSQRQDPHPNQNLTFSGRIWIRPQMDRIRNYPGQCRPTLLSGSFGTALEAKFAKALGKVE